MNMFFKDVAHLSQKHRSILKSSYKLMMSNLTSTCEHITSTLHCFTWWSAIS